MFFSDNLNIFNNVVLVAASLRLISDHPFLEDIVFHNIMVVFRNYPIFIAYEA